MVRPVGAEILENLCRWVPVVVDPSVALGLVQRQPTRRLPHGWKKRLNPRTCNPVEAAAPEDPREGEEGDPLPLPELRESGSGAGPCDGPSGAEEGRSEKRFVP